MWIFVALVADTVLAAVGIIDKLILTKSISKPIIFVFYSTIFSLGLLFLFPFGIKFPQVWSDYAIFAVSGFCFALALWTMYIGLQKSEVSHLGPLIGATMPFFILFLSRIFLAEKLGTYGLLAAVVLMIGSLIISFDLRQSKYGWYGAMGWGVLAGFLFAVSHVTAKYSYDVYGFYSGFVLTKFPLGIFGLALLFSPAVRSLFGKKPAPEQSADKTTANKKGAYLVIGNMALGVIGTTLVQYAAALGSVSLVNALAGAQYALLIVFVALISKFFPKILKETFTKKEIIQKTTAVAVISLGLVLLFIK
ncbi:MAG TPA: DMT family transporter [Candidatus Udaeobacter sp.]|nr:DMT family transporter [Candidatus Udaeobacter sp.]